MGDITDMSTDELVYKIRLLNKKFRRACTQVVLLNNRIEMMKTRYERARRDTKRSYRYTQRLQLCAFEGVRNMFYEYACQKCDELEELQAKLVERRGSGFNSDNDLGEDSEENSENEEQYEEEDYQASENNEEAEAESENDNGDSSDSNNELEVQPPHTVK